jgi:hypothetical protein
MKGLLHSTPQPNFVLPDYVYIHIYLLFLLLRLLLLKLLPHRICSYSLLAAAGASDYKCSLLLLTIVAAAAVSGCAAVC